MKPPSRGCTSELARSTPIVQFARHARMKPNSFANVNLGVNGLFFPILFDSVWQLELYRAVKDGRALAHFLLPYCQITLMEIALAASLCLALLGGFHFTLIYLPYFSGS